MITVNEHDWKYDLGKLSYKGYENISRSGGDATEQEMKKIIAEREREIATEKAKEKIPEISGPKNYEQDKTEVTVDAIETESVGIDMPTDGEGKNDGNMGEQLEEKTITRRRRRRSP